MREFNDKLIFSKYTKFLENENEVIIINGKSGVWGVLDKDKFELVRECILKEIAHENYILKIESESTRSELNDIFEVLIDEEMIVNDNMEKENIQIDNVEFKLTGRCNLNCIHCAADCDINGKEILNTEDVKIILDKLINLDIKTLMLTGGEPLIRKDIIEILKHIRSKFKGKLSIITNGTLITEELALDLKKCLSDISISLDGYNEESTNFVRGKGVYTKIVQAIENLKNAGFKKEEISLTMTVTSQNSAHIDDFMLLCEKLEVEGGVRQFAAEGRGVTNFNKIGMVSYPDLSFKNEDELEELRGKLKCNIVCKAGINKLTINEFGDMYPCLFLEKKEFKIGNILNEDLDVIFNSKEYKSFINQKIIKSIVDNEKNHKCKNCNVRYFCMNDCLGYNNIDYNNDIILKEKCTHMKPILNKILWDK